jgi:hypothetical protein
MRPHQPHACFPKGVSEFEPPHSLTTNSQPRILNISLSEISASMEAVSSAAGTVASSYAAHAMSTERGRGQVEKGPASSPSASRNPAGSHRASKVAGGSHSGSVQGSLNASTTGAGRDITHRTSTDTQSKLSCNLLPINPWRTLPLLSSKAYQGLWRFAHRFACCNGVVWISG